MRRILIWLVIATVAIVAMKLIANTILGILAAIIAAIIIVASIRFTLGWFHG